jgi:hypothetical protein
LLLAATLDVQACRLKARAAAVFHALNVTAAQHMAATPQTACIIPWAALKRVMNNVEGEQQHQRSAGNVWRACLQRASLSALAA